MGIARTTFVIDEKGNIAEIIDKVDTAKHAGQILGS
jgi:peroxiredoxin Q/BCP